jgi:Cu+-exporting ATPase
MMGKWLELLAKGRTSEAIQKLMQLQPPVAVVLQFDKGGHVVSETEVPTELLQLRDIVKVVPGSKIPCDGKVVTGWTAVDESMVTGESMPVSKTIGDKVVAGTVNTTGMVHVRAEGVGEQTMLANIIKLVEDAQTSKAPIQAYADYISARFVPVVVVTSVLVGVLWLVLVNTGAVPPSWLEDDTSRGNEYVFAFLFSVSVLVIACPCALGLAVPTAVMVINLQQCSPNPHSVERTTVFTERILPQVGTGVGAKFGVLIKGGAPLEMGHKVRGRHAPCVVRVCATQDSGWGSIG